LFPYNTHDKITTIIAPRRLVKPLGNKIMHYTAMLEPEEKNTYKVSSSEFLYQANLYNALFESTNSLDEELGGPLQIETKRLH
jgi:hypothetical protein